MQLRRGEDLAWIEGPEEWFAGEVRFGRHNEPSHETDLVVLGVSFDPGARTHWHSHPEGQVLYVLEGKAFVKTEDGEHVEAGPGDTVYAPAGELHWHGAAPDSSMTHLSITYGGATEWAGREVTDEEYGG